jgi:hypothetical protein
VDRSRIERAAKMWQVERRLPPEGIRYGLRGFEMSTLARDTASRVGSVGAGIWAVAAG